MSAYLDDEEFEEWLQSGDLTITEWMTERNLRRVRIVNGAWNKLLAPGLRTAFIEVLNQQEGGE